MDARVSTDWLAAHLADVRVVDLRWYLGGKDARAEYDEGHIPGAVFVDLDRDLSGDPARGPGRHPLPSPARFEAAMARAGIGADTDVVVYDDSAGSIAARLWYLLRLFGHRAGVAVLDGGLPRWVAEGRPLETGAPAVAASGFRADPSRLAAWVVDRAAVDAARRDPKVLLLDARAPERYRGDSEPVDPRPGHIPGARSAPWAGNVEGGVLRAPAALRARYAALGAERAERVIVYCGSGVTACHDLLALHLAGFADDRLQLYAGSWSDWARTPGLPAATGDDPG